MTVAACEMRTVPVMPLGRRGRYTLTPQQQKAYIALVRFVDRTGVIPTLDELGEELGLFKTATWKLVAGLQERGWVTVDMHRARGIALLDPVLRDLKPVDAKFTSGNLAAQ